ncbi:Ku protein|uniref:Non-homologous end joining protein Ku n=1 Tax=Dendrosporobacter quercicolus TaxID=146817 RepID=A0A1G9ZBU2_9FIRM|nr:Ku protein [Dendrosporobacter quercicolus]NSL49772.1 Ku protein [Dendrosporobacter quercicolus DSM 1736]SDN18910.1 DNA end-binding protein Ku [Dendrosporobacter quercicolus]
MPRPVWSGSISFGLVNVPVKMYNTVRRKTIRFNQLRKSDGCRIRLKKTCAADGAEVTNEQIVKGYEISPDQYVIVTQDDLDALNPKASKTIAIEDFVLSEQINPIYYEQAYYLVPDKSSVKAYMLLLSAMQSANRVAIARLVIRNKEQLTAIRPADNLLTLSTMHFADEMIPHTALDDLPADQSPPDKRELAIAMQLIESLSTDFDHQKYHDDYREKVMEMIEQKAEGQQIVNQPAATQNTKVVDLMAALEASLAAIKKDQPEPAKTRRKKSRAQ